MICFAVYPPIEAVKTFNPCIPGGITQTLAEGAERTSRRAPISGTIWE